MLSGLKSALGVLVYVFLVALFMFNAESLFGDTPDFLIPVFMMTLLVVSATTTGLLVLWKPINMFITGEKRGALKLLFSTLSWLVLFLVIVALVLIFS